MIGLWENHWPEFTHRRLRVEWQKFESVHRPRFETFVDLTPGEIAMKIGADENPLSCQPVSDSALERVADSEWLVFTSEAQRSIAKEVLAWRKDRDERKDFRAYDLDEDRIVWGRPEAIYRLREMQVELERWRTGKRFRPDLGTAGTRTAWEAVFAAIKAGNPVAFDNPQSGMESAVKEIARLYGEVEELEEWRTGKRERSQTINQRQQAEQMGNVREVLVGLGWTPPQS